MQKAGLFQIGIGCNLKLDVHSNFARLASGKSGVSWLAAIYEH
jgi:hypothetical protein